ncbi:bolA-like protein 1 [Amblyomma americanum]
MQRCFAFMERRLLTCGATYFVTRAASGGQTEARILKKLKEALTPQELLVENESHMHNVPKATRHGVRRPEGGTRKPGHALAIQTSTPDQRQSKTEKSPPCLGGMKRERRSKE